MDPDPNLALDALISILDAEEGDDSAQSAVEDEGGTDSESGDDIPLVQSVNRDYNLPSSLTDPVPDSPVRKRQKLKQGHCKYCDRICTRLTLEDHLFESDECRDCYFEDLKVTNVEAVLCQLFSCIFCPEQFYHLTSHLSSSPACLQMYCAKFSVNTVR